MRIPVVDNGGQWTHREYRRLRDLNVESEVVPNTTPYEKLRADGIVLSGGALSMEGKVEGLEEEGRYLDVADVPVLAICVGHQFMAMHFGGQVRKALTPEFGRVGIELDGETSPVFRGLPRTFNAWASHNDEVVKVPPGFAVTALSPTCRVEAISHHTRPLYGLQFHPEVEHTEHGERIFQNFIDLCRR